MSILPTTTPSVPSTMLSIQIDGFQTPSPDSFRIAAAAVNRGGEAVAAFQAPSTLSIPTPLTSPDDGGFSPTFPSTSCASTASTAISDPFAAARATPIVSPTKPRSPTKWVVDPNIPTAYQSTAPLTMVSSPGSSAPRLVTQYGLDRLATIFGF